MSLSIAIIMSEKARKHSISQRNADILRAICHLNAKQRSALLSKANFDFMRCICECAFNILRGNVPLEKKYKTRLRKHAPILRKLVDRRDNVSKKKKIIVQNGGFLPSLLIPIVSHVLTSLLAQ